MKKLYVSTLFIMGSLLLFTGCSKETDADKIADAQACLDTATAAEAATCVAKVDGLESPAAYLIRCAGKFVKEGYNDSTKLAAAMSNTSGTDTGSDGST